MELYYWLILHIFNFGTQIFISWSPFTKQYFNYDIFHEVVFQECHLQSESY